ncbi:MAG TPA: aminomethyl-transferring glycine dehydrogenase subunit GcvPB [Thermoplasmata archaeon]|nr:aminomethyl-transferring glycine dehydrogenase subunit GcvPB [Thermoplasmata archaeon]
MSYRQAYYDEPLLFEKKGNAVEPADLSDVPQSLWRESLALPNLAEHEVVRHYTRLSQMNFGIDTGFYPLGSCTMKFNPKFAEELARLPEVARVHPDQDPSTVQGALRILYELQELLAKISGMDAVTLQPAAGAQGELLGLLLARAYHQDHGDGRRNEVILPDTAHGTNFASAGMLGFHVKELPSADGRVDLSALKRAVNEKTLALMLTNPNTLGIFEDRVVEIAQICHEAGALLYYDGANFNAILGKTSPGKMGFDITHFNTHKTFTTPHGGGGPGAGPVGVKKLLEPYLPVPAVTFDGTRYALEWDRPKSIGKVRAWLGNFALLVRAYAYILGQGSDGLTGITERAVLNANYLRSRLQDHLPVPFSGLRKHEFVASGAPLKAKGVRTVDIAKRLIDHGFHPPTVYFPHLVDEALMIEPTETETRETLDAFAEALIRITREDPAVLKSAPHNAAVGRVDEVRAAREPILSWRMLKDSAAR